MCPEGRRKAALRFSGHTGGMQAFAVAVLLLHGVVTMGPTQPVCQIGTPCTKPAADVQLRFTRPGLTKSVRTDLKGRYSITLPRGTFAVQVVPARKIGGGVKPQRVTVRTSGQRIDFDLDTGIR
jgi:hypothetical protein